MLENTDLLSLTQLFHSAGGNHSNNGYHSQGRTRASANVLIDYSNMSSNHLLYIFVVHNIMNNIYRILLIHNNIMDVFPQNLLEFDRKPIRPLSKEHKKKNTNCAKLSWTKMSWTNLVSSVYIEMSIESQWNAWFFK